MKPTDHAIEFRQGDRHIVHLRCLHEKQFPPGIALLDENPEALRAKGMISDVEYQKYQTWQRVCNRTEMLTEVTAEQAEQAMKPCQDCDLCLVEPRGNHRKHAGAPPTKFLDWKRQMESRPMPRKK